MPTRSGIRISGFPVEVTETDDALTLESEGSRDLILTAGSGSVGVGGVPSADLSIESSGTSDSVIRINHNSATGDPFLKLTTNAVNWAVGLDNSDADKFKIASGATPSTNARLTIDTSGEATFAGDVVVTGVLDVKGGSIAFGNADDVDVDFDATAHNVAGKSLSILAGTTTAGTTNNIAGGSFTIAGGQGKGSGAGGDIIFKTANAGSSGSSLNALTTALTISGEDGSAEFAGTLVCEGLVTNYATKTSSYECTATDFLIIASGSGTTITLPENADAGTIYKVKRVDGSNSITVSRKTSDTIDGATTYVLDVNYMMVEVMSDGSNWHVTGAYEVPE